MPVLTKFRLFHFTGGRDQPTVEVLPGGIFENLEIELSMHCLSGCVITRARYGIVEGIKSGSKVHQPCHQPAPSGASSPMQVPNPLEERRGWKLRACSSLVEGVIRRRPSRRRSLASLPTASSTTP